MKLYRTNRHPDFRKHQRDRIIRRKTKLAARIGWTVKHSGALAKGKIHCSCPWCSAKSGSDGYPKSQAARRDDSSEQLRDVRY